EYEMPRLAKIASADIPRTVTIGESAQATLGIEVDGEPSSEAQVDYFVSNKDGQVMIRGTAQPADTGTFVIDIPGEETGKLSAGPNQLKIFANSNFAFSPDISTTTILASSTGSTGGQTGGNQTNGTTSETAPSGCLIATAAFGSELTPQVQYLRSFRQDYILSTASGSAFMNAFNSIYYSFSPQVADYEREQPWLQATVKTAIYPLFGILTAAEKAHFAASGGEAGVVAAGAVASSLIGAVYLWPAAVAKPVQRRFGAGVRIALVVLAGAGAAIAAGMALGDQTVLTVGTSLFVLAAASAAAMATGRLARKAYEKAARYR
ncbi:MAG TPA: CFI-box-CTERM domain-containing protein, partial [Nitrososphaera sp.]